jgi:hypothetical protein
VALRWVDGQIVQNESFGERAGYIVEEGKQPQRLSLCEKKNLPFSSPRHKDAMLPTVPPPMADAVLVSEVVYGVAESCLNRSSERTSGRARFPMKTQMPLCFSLMLRQVLRVESKVYEN